MYINYIQNDSEALSPPQGKDEGTRKVSFGSTSDGRTAPASRM